MSEEIRPVREVRRRRRLTSHSRCRVGPIKWSCDISIENQSRVSISYEARPNDRRMGSRTLKNVRDTGKRGVWEGGTLRTTRQFAINNNYKLLQLLHDSTLCSIFSFFLISPFALDCLVWIFTLPFEKSSKLSQSAGQRGKATPNNNSKVVWDGRTAKERSLLLWSFSFICLDLSQNEIQLNFILTNELFKWWILGVYGIVKSKFSRFPCWLSHKLNIICIFVT